MTRRPLVERNDHTEFQASEMFWYGLVLALALSLSAWASVLVLMLLGWV